MREYLTRKQKIAIAGGITIVAVSIPAAYLLYKYFFPPEKPCVYDTDCPVGYECVDGVCQKTVTPQCTTDTDCLAGFQCIGGKCVYVEPDLVTISGTVIELREGYVYAPVSGAKVIATNATTGEIYTTSSDINGDYVLENMTPDIYNMTTSKMGYCPYTVSYLDWTYPGSWDYGYLYNAIRKIMTEDVVWKNIYSWQTSVNKNLGMKYKINKISGKIRTGGSGGPDWAPISGTYEFWVDGYKAYSASLRLGSWIDVNLSFNRDGTTLTIKGETLCYVDEVDLVINVTELESEVC